MAAALRVGGMVPLTTLDYPGRLACVLFCQGCAWRCRYCHNPQLIDPRGEQLLGWSSLRAFLERRRGLLEAVVFSGGEPTLQPALAAAMQQVRELGFAVGLHSAGIKPAALARVLPLADWVGFDVKALAEDAPALTGVANSGRVNWRSLQHLLDSGVEHEVRTTVHWQLLDPQRLLRLGERLASAGVKRFAVQLVRPQRMLDEQLQIPVQPEGLNALWQVLDQSFDSFVLRG